jgi:DNA polymerase IIIc chi subunit
MENQFVPHGSKEEEQQHQKKIKKTKKNEAQPRR